MCWCFNLFNHFCLIQDDKPATSAPTRPPTKPPTQPPTPPTTPPTTQPGNFVILVLIYTNLMLILLFLMTVAINILIDVALVMGRS